MKLLFVSLLALLAFVYRPARAEDSGPELPGFFDSGFVTNGFFGPSEANQEADRDVSAIVPSLEQAEIPLPDSFDVDNELTAQAPEQTQGQTENEASLKPPVEAADGKEPAASDPQSLPPRDTFAASPKPTDEKPEPAPPSARSERGQAQLNGAEFIKKFREIRRIQEQGGFPSAPAAEKEGLRRF